MNKSHKSFKKTFALLCATSMIFSNNNIIYTSASSTKGVMQTSIYNNFSPINFTTEDDDLNTVDDEKEEEKEEIVLASPEISDFTLDFTGKSEWNYDGVNFSGGTSIGDSGTWQWNNISKTLTLDDFTFATSADVAVILPENSNIVLKALSNNTIVSTSDAQDNNSYGIYAPDGGLTITGLGDGDYQGQISVASGSVDNKYDVSTCAINVENGDLTIDNATVVVKAGEVIKLNATTLAFSTGIGVFKEDVSSTNASGSNAKLNIKNDSYIEILSGDGDKDAGLRVVDVDISVNDSFLITEGNAFGIYAIGNSNNTINITDSYVESIAKGYDGMYLQNISNFTVNGSKIIAKGGTQGDSCGINIIDANLNLNDATIEAIGSMYGISSLKNPQTANLDYRYITIEGGIIVAKGGTVAFKTDINDDKLTLKNTDIYVKDNQDLYTTTSSLADNPKDIKIYSRAEEYDVTFDFNYDNAPSGQTKRTVDKVITDINLYEPTRDGYNFVGWYFKSDNTIVNGSTEFEKDSTVYALWDMKALEVTFDAVGGTVGTNDRVQSTFADGTLINIPSAVKSEHELIGWFLTKEAPANGDDVQVDYDTTFDANTTVYARWKSLYVITFNATEGAVLKSTDVTNSDDTMNEFPIPKREDHAFAGWFTSRTGGEMITTDTEFNSNTMVYAQWIEDEYTIILDPNYTEGYLSSVPTEDHSLSAIPEIIRDEYDLVSFYDAPVGGNEVTVDTVFDSNTTLYASWVVEAPSVNHRITFDSQGASIGTVVLETNSLDMIDDYPIPQIEGESFDGWYTSANGGSRVVTSNIYTEDTVVFAQWSGGSTSDSSVSTSTTIEPEVVTPTYITTYDIPTMSGLYINEFQNLQIGDIVLNLRGVDPELEYLGQFVGWYHGSSMSTPVSYEDLGSLLVTQSVLDNGIYPMYQEKVIVTTQTIVPDTSKISLNKLF